MLVQRSHVRHMGLATMTLCIERGTSLAVRKGLLRARKHAPKGIVIHTTGSGPWQRWKRDPDKHENPYEAALYVYERISKFSGHYLVSGDDGTCINLVDPMTVAWHVGSKGSWRYRVPGWDRNKGLGWWHTRFPACDSPRGLLGGALWRRGSANVLSIGIEVSPPTSHPRASWDPKTWETLRALTGHLSQRYRIPQDRYHILTHSDVHPLTRTRKSGAPWDPAPAQWLIGQARLDLNLV